MDNEVIIHWATVLLKWVSSFKVTLQYCLFCMITIGFLDTIYFSLQFSPSLLCYSHFVLYDKMDAEASSESLWFCKGMVVFGFTLLNLFHCIFLPNLSSSQDVFHKCRQIQKKHFSTEIIRCFFPFFCVWQNKVDFFSRLFHVLLILNSGDDFVWGLYLLWLYLIDAQSLLCLPSTLQIVG